MPRRRRRPASSRKTRSSTMTDGRSKSSLTGEKADHRTGKETIREGRSRATINELPDVALLEIFDFYVDNPLIDSWHTLVHVCRRWRGLVFGSPHRLNLRLHCTDSRPVMEMVDIWPPLPIVLETCGDQVWRTDNIFAAFEHNDRICQIFFDPFPYVHFEEVLEDLQQPFPALTHLRLVFDEEELGEEESESSDEEDQWPVLPASFLGGSAPCLQTLILRYVSFPGLPNLLLSAAHLVNLDIWSIPNSGYISPEAMATGLSVLTRLERLHFGFKSPQSRDRQNGRPVPSQTRVLLPALIEWIFKGSNEYLEDLVARIDTPLLGTLDITFFHEPIFDTPELNQFISRTPNFQTHDRVLVVFSLSDVSVRLPQTLGKLELGVSFEHSDFWHLSSLARVCSSSLPQALLPAVEYLFIFEEGNLYWEHDVENSDWLELFHPFTAVKKLYMREEFTDPIAFALQELVGERVIEVLPVLQTLCFKELPAWKPVQKATRQFISARKLAGRPAAVHCW